MDIDVVIPTFNRADRVVRAIESVFGQSYPIRSVIVVDDGSTDNTKEIISTKFPAVRLISQANKGVSAARNAGVRAATSAWIAFLDSDDEWLAPKLTRQVAALAQCRAHQPEYEVCHTDEIWMRNGRRVNPMNKHAKPNGWIFEQCLPLCCVSPSSILLKTRLLHSVGLFDESLPACEDYDLWLRLFSRVPALLVAEKLLIKYGGHEDQLSKKYRGMDRFRVRSLIQLLEQNGLSQHHRQAARDMLLQKLNVLMRGYAKRGNLRQLCHYKKLYGQWGDRSCCIS